MPRRVPVVVLPGRRMTAGQPRDETRESIVSLYAIIRPRQSILSIQSFVGSLLSTEWTNRWKQTLKDRRALHEAR
jgi:hypothetical protein